MSLVFHLRLYAINNVLLPEIFFRHFVHQAAWISIAYGDFAGNATMKRLSDTYNDNYYQMHEFSYSCECRQDHKRILELLQIKPCDKTLEIGCGFGILLSKVSAETKVGVETNDVAIDECRRRGVKVVQADAEKGLPFKDSYFDIIIMNEVISHLNKPALALKECLRVLTQGGKIVLTAPARSIFFRNISATHLSEMTVKELQNLVERCGFVVLSHEVSGISFLYPLMQNLLFNPFRFLRGVLRRNKMQTVQLIDRCHGLADKTLLKPFGIYRKRLLALGLNQMVLAQKRRDRGLFTEEA